MKTKQTATIVESKDVSEYLKGLKEIGVDSIVRHWCKNSNLGFILTMRSENVTEEETKDLRERGVFEYVISFEKDGLEERINFRSREASETHFDIQIEALEFNRSKLKDLELVSNDEFKKIQALRLKTVA